MPCAERLIMAVIMDDQGVLLPSPRHRVFSEPGGGAAPRLWPCSMLLAFPPQGCWCCTGRPTAPHPGASMPRWPLPAVDQGAPGAALSPRSVCPTMGMQVLDSAAVPRAGLAHTAAWLCVLKTATPTMGQGLVTRYRWDRASQVGQEWCSGFPLSLLLSPRAWVCASVLRALGAPTVPRSWMADSWSGKPSWTAASQL